MAKYRPIDTRLWHDRKFLSLGDDGRMLWLFLLTAPSSIAIPGIVIGGEASLAEQLGWSVERLREGFRELFAKGLSVRVDGRLVWLQNALRYQPPANPNVVKGWAKAWDDIPECALKRDIWEALKIACKSWAKLFEQEFPEPSDDGSCNGSANRFDNGSGNRCTQDQDQDQDQDLKLSLSRARESFDPNSPADRMRLARWTYEQVADARDRIAAELGIVAVPMPREWGAAEPVGFRDLRERIRAEGEVAPQACRAVVETLTRQAREDRSVEWLSEKAFTEGGWRTARNGGGKRLRAGQKRAERPLIGAADPRTDHPEGERLRDFSEL